MSIGEMTNENHIQDKHAFYEKYYESCEKKSDKLTQNSNRVSLYRIITAAASGLMLFLWYRQKIPVLLVSAFGFGFAFLMLIRCHSIRKWEMWKP